MYITASKDRVLSGDPLCLFIADEAERKQLVSEVSRAFLYNVLQLSNGDYMVLEEL